MPGLTGIQFYKYLETYYPQLTDRVLFITAGSWDSESSQFIKRNSKNTIFKPFDLDELQKRLND